MKRLLKLFFIAFFFLIVGVGIYLLVFPNREAFERQHTEEELADQYINYWKLIQQGKEDQANKFLNQWKGEEWEDLNWYTRDGITFTPDYAQGFLECVLEIPSVKIRRGVYSGTWEEIQYNLDIWMVTAARPDYEFGKTHYCIYGHNHTTQDLSFNRLKDVKVGETFTLTTEKKIYYYKVTNVFAEWRESVTTQYVDNFNLLKETCYIVTCGRNENRYKDIVVEGVLYKITPLE